MPARVVAPLTVVPLTDMTDNDGPVSFVRTLPVAVRVVSSSTAAVTGVAVGAAASPVTSTVRVNAIVSGEVTVVVVFTMLPLVAT